MGYCYIVASCAGCEAVFTCNPSYTPSIRINGVKQPICRSCFNRWNAHHRPDDPLKLHPQAYEAIPEELLGDTSAQHDPRYRGESHTTPSVQKEDNNDKAQ